MSENLFYSAGDLIFQQGYPADNAYVIINGQVEIFQEQPDGTKKQLALLENGQMFGELGVLDDAPRSASARAHTDVELQIMPL